MGFPDQQKSSWPVPLKWVALLICWCVCRDMLLRHVHFQWDKSLQWSLIKLNKDLGMWHRYQNSHQPHQQSTLPTNFVTALAPHYHPNPFLWILSITTCTNSVHYYMYGIMVERLLMANIFQWEKNCVAWMILMWDYDILKCICHK